MARVRARREEQGAAAVEFALVMPMLMLLVFGLIQYGLYFWALQSGSRAADVTARQLSVGNCQDGTALRAFVTGQLGSAASGTATVSEVYTRVDGSAGTATNSAGGTVKVTVSFPTVNLHLPFVPFLSSPSVAQSVTARVEDTTDQGCGT
ncbi:MAG: TadE/TadG family type IV pilus assembly protein [Marmoricola sp.]